MAYVLAIVLDMKTPYRTNLLCLALLSLVTLMNASAESKDHCPGNTQLATLGGGCFWCLDAVFRTLPGVKTLTCGYAGGKTDHPTYEQVCTKTTGHAEVVQIEFDPAQVSYEKLLELFWKMHDPTTLNRQGADVGPQYRSAIFYHNEAQKLAAEKSKQQAQRRFSDPIVTEIAPLTKFWPAEDYHQDYFRKNPTAGYCRLVIKPKLDKLKAH